MGEKVAESTAYSSIEIFCVLLKPKGFPKGRNHSLDMNSDLWHEKSWSGCSRP